MNKETWQKMFFVYGIPRKSGKQSDFEKGRLLIQRDGKNLAEKNKAIRFLREWVGL